MAARLELYPSMMAQVSTIGIEGGWAQGDDGSTLLKVEGNALPFSPAYNVDNLLFKHVIPTIYNIEGSVINAIYAKVYANMKLSENLGFTPQVLFAWNDQTNAISAFDSNYVALANLNLGPGIGNTEVEKYLGTEIEGTLSWTLHPGVNLDFIGSVILAGDGLTGATRGSRCYRSRGYDLGVPDKADGLHRSVREIKTNQSSQSLNEAGSLTKVARFFFVPSMTSSMGVEVPYPT